MNKTIRNSLIILGIVAILFVVIWFVYDMVKKEPVDVEANTNLVDGNTGLDNMINDLLEEDTTPNEVEQNVVPNQENNEIVENEVIEENKTGVQGSTTESVTSKEEKAVKLVQKEWGTTEGVYFSNESIDAQGRYIISVRDKKTTASLAFYMVDVDRQLITEQ